MNYPFLKNYWLWVVAVLVVGIFFFFVTFEAPTPLNSARLTIKFDGGGTRAFEGPVDENTTVLQALIFASKEGSFDLRYSLDKAGKVNLASIGEAVNGPKNWHFYLNGRPVEMEELDTTKVKKGDLIEARYE